MEALEHSKWSGKTDGTSWMQRALISLIRVLGVRVLYGVMATVVPFYMVANRKGYKAMRQYFVERRGDSRLKAVWHIYRNHFVFGQIILDRFAVYGGKMFRFEEEGQELFDEVTRMEQGMVMLSSHVGNYEMAGYMLESAHKRYNALVYAGETETIMENRRRVFARHNMNMIPVREDMSHLFEMNAALDGGEIVSLPADRVFGSQKTLVCDFLGAKAQFPMGAFALAAQKEVPVMALFVMKENAKTYKAFMRKIEVPDGLNIKQRMAHIAQRFADELAAVLERYPYQWFNYYDFWELQ